MMASPGHASRHGFYERRPPQMTSSAERPSARAPHLVAPDDTEAHAEPIKPVLGRNAKARQKPAHGIRPARGAPARLERALAEVREVLGITLNNVEQGIIMIDAQHYVRLYNKKFADLLDLPQRILTDPL